ncbi:unnamed protein product [Boreogadus saida]
MLQFFVPQEAKKLYYKKLRQKMKIITNYPRVPTMCMMYDYLKAFVDDLTQLLREPSEQSPGTDPLPQQSPGTDPVQTRYRSRIPAKNRSPTSDGATLETRKHSVTCREVGGVTCGQVGGVVSDG